MSATQKLTKKQKKGLAFRERKTGKRQPSTANQREKDGIDDMEDNAVPAMEDQDHIGADGGEAEVEGVDDKKAGKARGHQEGDVGRREEGKVGGKGKSKAKEEDVREPVSVLKKSGKRKREIEGEEEDEEKEKDDTAKKLTKRKKVAGGEQDDKGKQRFILFVGEYHIVSPVKDLCSSLL